MADIRAILFDKDGVFVDFEKTWTPVLKEIARELADGDVALSHALLDAAGFDAEADCFLPASVWGAGHAEDLMRAWAPLLGEKGAGTVVATVERHCLAAQPHPVLPGTQQPEVFAALKASGLFLGVATNDVHSSAMHTIRQFALEGVFDLVLGFDSVANPKPAGDPVVHFADAMNIAPAHVMMVGDNVHDMACGRAGGAGLCVGVASGNSPHAVLSESADHVLEDIAALPEFVARLGPDKQRG